MTYIRKSAHFTEFFILGVVITFMHLIIKKTQIFTVLFILLSIAVIDEFIQALTGRTASVKDIILDFCGAITGLTTAFIIYFILKLIIKTKNSFKKFNNL